MEIRPGISPHPSPLESLNDAGYTWACQLCVAAWDSCQGRVPGRQWPLSTSCWPLWERLLSHAVTYLTPTKTRETHCSFSIMWRSFGYLCAGIEWVSWSFRLASASTPNRARPAIQDVGDDNDISRNNLRMITRQLRFSSFSISAAHLIYDCSNRTDNIRESLFLSGDNNGTRINPINH